MSVFIGPYGSPTIPISSVTDYIKSNYSGISGGYKF